MRDQLPEVPVASTHQRHLVHKLEAGARTDVVILLGTNEKPDGKEQQAQDYIYIPASDVFMFACLAYEILCGRVYFSERTTGGACAGTLAGERPVLPACAELKILTDLITACWAQNPVNRPTFAVIAPRLKALLDNLIALKGSPAV